MKRLLENIIDCEYLNELAQLVHNKNIKWWQDVNTGERISRNNQELLALIISELSEALEGERKNLMDDKLPHRKMAEVEMADALIRLLDYCGGFKIPFLFDSLTNKGIPQNKGEAIFIITKEVTDIEIPFASGLHAHNVATLIRNYCGVFGYDLVGAMEEKLNFNSTRKDHTHEHRKEEGGKKF